MNVTELKQSRFLTRADVGTGVLVTIRSVFQENVAKEGAPQEMRWCIDFDELDKPMVLNSTNGQLIAQITKSDESDNWTGHKIVLYDDPSVSFGGKLTGGIRVRAARPQATANRGATKPAPAAAKPQQKPVPRPTPAPAPEPGPESEPPFPDDPGIDVPF